ncbi:homocysteine biosynthesis protein [Candidatus Contubernalis alkaliaceticus]|uniref:homocysteine biosynthesis protein n=1 Tax=Candidatus Contubernalis alkaliaceticus TaxID=338645 RepID=UPI001F4C1C5A|nr:homocysteine biosynthesis protein [Candidatus Contubernalis alkalaceticus]
MKVNKTYEEINEKIRKGEAVVMTAEEIISVVEEKGLEEAAREVDVVTTGTFGPMCSSGAFLNLCHPMPRIRMSEVYLNGVSAYAGIAAVDAYLGATEIPKTDSANQNYPGEFNYGGGHVIEDLIAGKEVFLEAYGYGTDCYPRKKLETYMKLEDMNEALMFNVRNAYQNYNVAVNSSDKTIYTYMGILKPKLGNANYSTSGQLSPLFNDPLYRTTGIGTRIFLGGGIGYVSWHGTQHNPCAARDENGVPKGPSGTLSVMGDMKQMDSQWIRGVSFLGYGVSLMVGIGVPIPILNEEILKNTAVKDEDIFAPVVEYSEGYSYGKRGPLGEVTYAQLKSGMINIDGKEIPTAPLSSYSKAKEIAEILKAWITEGNFLIAEPVEKLPSIDSGKKLNPITIRTKGEEIKW